MSRRLMSTGSPGLRDRKRDKAIGGDVDDGLFATFLVLLLETLDVQPSEVRITTAKLRLEGGDGLGAASGFGDLGLRLELSRLLFRFSFENPHLPRALRLHQCGFARKGAVVHTELRETPKYEGENRHSADGQRDRRPLITLH